MLVMSRGIDHGGSAMKNVQARTGHPESEAAVFWRQTALCAGRAELFFPPSGREPEPARSQREQAATALCQRCPVRARCLDFALRNHISFGIWGGRTERDRTESIASQ
jgi:WhiB family transcriptional regulator, redox-sensing transcriptional regulator